MNMNEHTRPVESEADIPPHLRNSPIEELLQYHNLGRELIPVEAPRLLIGMCMDNRKHLRIPTRNDKPATSDDDACFKGRAAGRARSGGCHLGRRHPRRGAVRASVVVLGLLPGELGEQSAPSADSGAIHIR